MWTKYILLLFSLLIMCQEIKSSTLKLKQILIFSRHNVRTGVRLDNQLRKFSSKKWPRVEVQPGRLTQKGYLLEGYMGEYFSKWLKSEKFLTNECPLEDSVYVYSNSINRTIATAQAFVESAFRGCNISVYYKQPRTEGEMDPIFAPIIRNTTNSFKIMVFNEINRKQNNSKLKQSLSVMNKILDIQNADVCRTNSICDLTDISQNKIIFELGSELFVKGPLFIATSALDSIIMNYYNGLSMEDIAWGFIRTPEMWQMITEISRQDQNIIYTTVSKDIGALLVSYLTKTFLHFDNMPKFTLIVGHDYNKNSILHLMDFKPTVLPNQYESYPIGGKIVFQRWTDNQNDYLKIEYIYASWTQIRNATKLSLNNPPQRVLLELKWCNINADGFCPWKEFINKLQDYDLQI